MTNWIGKIKVFHLTFLTLILHSLAFPLFPWNITFFPSPCLFGQLAVANLVQYIQLLLPESANRCPSVTAAFTAGATMDYFPLTN